MDFIMGLQKIVKQHDSIMVIVDSLIKVAHFILVKSTFLASDTCVHPRCGYTTWCFEEDCVR